MSTHTHNSRPAPREDVFGKFEKMERIELLAAELYHLLAAHFSDHPGEAEVFVRLEHQEIQHALRVRMACRDFLAARGRGGHLAVTDAELDALIAQGEAVLERLAAERPKIGFEEALATMQRLERDLAQAHARFTADEADPTLQAFFAMLSQEDRALQRTLRERRGLK